MDHMIMFDNHIESISSDLFNPQSNLESPYGDMALLSVIGYLLSRFFININIFILGFHVNFGCHPFQFLSMGPINLFVFAIFKFSELLRRNCLKPFSDDPTSQDIEPVNDGGGRWPEAQRDTSSSQEGVKNRNGGEVYDNRVFSTSE